MKPTKKRLLSGAVVSTLAVTLFSGCGTTKDSVSQAEKTEKNRPGIAETKAIAEEGFIYGLPLVMNYAANYEFWVDKTSSQYKCPFNEIYSESRVFTYKDTAVVTPNSDTPYSFVCLDLRAEPYALSGSHGRERALLLTSIHRLEHVQLRLHRQPRHRLGSRGLPRRRPGLEGPGPCWHQESVPLSKALVAEATQTHWTVISMKNDWKTVFPPEKK